MRQKQKEIDNGRIRTYACEHNAYDVSEEIAGHRLNHSATLSWWGSRILGLYTRPKHQTNNLETSCSNLPCLAFRKSRVPKVGFKLIR
jgi:hypothetical protein